MHLSHPLPVTFHFQSTITRLYEIPCALRDEGVIDGIQVSRRGLAGSGSTRDDVETGQFVLLHATGEREFAPLPEDGIHSSDILHVGFVVTGAGNDFENLEIDRLIQIGRAAYADET